LTSSVILDWFSCPSSFLVYFSLAFSSCIFFCLSASFLIAFSISIFYLSSWRFLILSFCSFLKFLCWSNFWRRGSTKSWFKLMMKKVMITKPMRIPSWIGPNTGSMLCLLRALLSSMRLKSATYWASVPYCYTLSSSIISLSMPSRLLSKNSCMAARGA